MEKQYYNIEEAVRFLNVQKGKDGYFNAKDLLPYISETGLKLCFRYDGNLVLLQKLDGLGKRYGLLHSVYYEGYLFIDSSDAKSIIKFGSYKVENISSVDCILKPQSINRQILFTCLDKVYLKELLSKEKNEIDLKFDIDKFIISVSLDELLIPAHQLYALADGIKEFVDQLQDVDSSAIESMRENNAKPKLDFPSSPHYSLVKQIVGTVNHSQVIYCLPNNAVQKSNAQEILEPTTPQPDHRDRAIYESVFEPRVRHILRLIKGMNLDPNDFPDDAVGRKPGSKDAILQQILNDSDIKTVELFWTSRGTKNTKDRRKIFDETWKRMRSEEMIISIKK